MTHRSLETVRFNLLRRRPSLCAFACRWETRSFIALALLIVGMSGAGGAAAQTLAARAKESGCTDAPRVVEGSMYRCSTASGVAAYFNVPGAGNGAGSRRVGGVSGTAPSPAGFPRVDAETQKNRDDVRRSVLNDELAAETKLLADARTQYADGAPVPLPEERADAEKYRARIGRLRQAVAIHERNIEALKKELATIR